MTTRARPRVLVVAGWYPSARDPLQGVFVLEHARAAARHHDVEVLVVERGPVQGARLTQVVDGVEHGLPTTRVRYSDRIPEALGGLVYVPRAVAHVLRRRRRPDVIHAHVYAAGLLGVVLGRVLRVPVVVSEHLSSFQLGTLSSSARRMAEVAFRGAAVVCPVSEALKRATQPLAPDTRFEVVPNVVDTELFRPGAAAGAAGPLLFVGMLDELKGVSTLLRALAAVRADGRPVRLDLVGRTPGLEHYEALARDLGLEGDAVTFHGVLPKEHVAALMRGASALVLPSRTETFGVVVIEALASGLPVVATRVGNLPELVDDAAGELVDPDDAPALAAAIGRVLDGRARFDRAALAGRTRERYGLEAIAERWREVYLTARTPRAAR